MMTFEDWKTELINQARIVSNWEDPCDSDFDWEAWRLYYNDGLTPQAAWLEDLSQG